MTRPLGDWRSQEGLTKGEYASDEVLPGWLPSHTRHTVAIDLGEGLGTQNDRGQQTLAGCKSRVRGVNACTPLKELSENALLSLMLGK